MPRFDGPIDIEPRDPTAGIRTPDTRCTCPGFCGGRGSADWLTCSSACKHCNPRTRRRRAPEHPRGEHDA